MQGRNHWVGGGHGPPTSISQSNKVQQFQFQTSGILLFMGVQKLYIPEISQFFASLAKIEKQAVSLKLDLLLKFL